MRERKIEKALMRAKSVMVDRSDSTGRRQETPDSDETIQDEISEKVVF